MKRELEGILTSVRRLAEKASDEKKYEVAGDLRRAFEFVLAASLKLEFRQQPVSTLRRRQ